MTVGLIGALIALALVDSTSFGTLVIPLGLMIAGRRVPARLILVFLISVATVYLAAGVALLLGGRAVGSRFDGIAESPLLAIPALVVGVALVVWSAVLARRKRGASHRRTGPTRLRERLEDPARPLRASAFLVMGVAAAGLEFVGMLPYLGAIGLIATSGLSGVASVLLLAGYCLLMILPALLLLVARTLAAGRLDRLIARLNAWLGRHATEALSWVVGIVGVVLILDGVGRLLSAR